jgi:hypothetical protein
MQVAHRAVIREIDFGKRVGVFFQDAAIIRTTFGWG